ncbi:MAG: hypothetical protein JWM11_6632 [Planctomycetaceae bacterium]|nr:hypothetical protein [Planctomycetaceae bacterium]
MPARDKSHRPSSEQSSRLAGNAQPNRPSSSGRPRAPKPSRAKSPEEIFLEKAAQIAEPWDENFTKFKHPLVLQGATYQPQMLFDVTPYPADPDSTPEANLVRSPNNEFAYMNRVWKRGQAIPLLQNRREGLVYWDQDVVIPVLLDGRTLAVWMSLTPMEVLTLREGISLAKGTVVIGGLGMGYLLRKVCEKPNVHRVIVVEQSRELLNWFGDRICAEQPKVTDVICGNAYEQLGKFDSETRYLFDIWPMYEDAAADPEFQAAKRKHPHVWGWGDYHLA